VNFAFICSNIPAAPTYGVYISQLIRYSIACCSYQDFLDRWLLPTRKLLNQMFLLVNLLSLISKGNNPSLQKLYSCHHDLVNRYGISVSQNDHGYVPLVIKHFPVLSSFMTYHRFVTSLTRRVPLVEQKLFTLPEHLSSSPVFSRVRVTRSLVLYVCLIYRSLFVLLYFFFWPLFLSSSICGF
jgi:hypothetical protein